MSLLRMFCHIALRVKFDSILRTSSGYFEYVGDVDAFQKLGSRSGVIRSYKIETSQTYVEGSRRTNSFGGHTGPCRVIQKGCNWSSESWSYSWGEKRDAEEVSAVICRILHKLEGAAPWHSGRLGSLVNNMPTQVTFCPHVDTSVFVEFAAKTMVASNRSSQLTVLSASSLCYLPFELEIRARR